MVDSACDLPPAFIEQHDICVIPTVVTLGDQVIQDRRDKAQTLDFYQHRIGKDSLRAQTAPCPPAMLRDIVLQEVMPKVDFAVYETVSRARSPTYEVAMQAAAGIISEGRTLRKASGATPFVLRVVNSRSLMVGQGLLAAETIRMIKGGIAVNEIRASVEKLSEQVHAYMVPTDLHYLRARANAKGDRSVSWLSATLGAALDVKPILEFSRDQTNQVAKVRGFDAAVHRMFGFAAEQIAAGLSAHYVVVGYGGDAAQIGTLPGYADLTRMAKKHNVELLACTTGLSAGINLGTGMVMIAFACERPLVWA